jgi:hypothetical protein
MAPHQLSLQCSCTPTYETWSKPEGEIPPSAAIIEGLAEVKDVDPLELDPLFEQIDLDALDQLFDHSDGAQSALLSYSLDRWNVFVRQDGHILICDSDRQTEPSPIFD